MGLSDVSLSLVDSLDKANEVKAWLGERRDVLAIDTETGGLEWWSQPLRMVVLGDEMRGYAIPWDRWAGLVYEVVPAYEGEVVFHNAKYDLHFLDRFGVKLDRARVHDTAVMSHLLDPLAPRALKSLGDKYVHPLSSSGQSRLKETMAKNKWTWATVPYDYPPYWAYAAIDGVLTARLHSIFRPQVATTFREVYDLEMAVLMVVSEMETRGIRIDSSYAERKLEELQAYIEQMRAYVGETWGVSPTSNRQVAEAFIADGVRLTKTTPNNDWAMDEGVLSEIDHPLARSVLDIRKAQKYAKTYFHNLLTRLDGDVIHCDVNTLGARTGRMAISNPSLQNQPRGTLVRDAFIARHGNRLVSVDYDQIEMRLLAHFAREESMIAAIHAGVDLHNHTAQTIYGDDFTKEQRQGMKGVNFGRIYGAGVATMARSIGCSVEEARAFVALHSASFPGVDRFMRELEGVARERLANEGLAYVRTPIGRRQPIESDRLYSGVNYLIQGTAADVLKLALVRLDLAGLGDYMLLPVHDEVILDVPADSAQEIAAEVQKVMTDRDTFSVPLTAGADVLPERWGDKYR